LHDASHRILVAWSLEQVVEGVGDVFVDALAVLGALVGLVWSRKEAVAALVASIGTLLSVLLGFVVEDSAAVDSANWGELRVFAELLGIVVW